MSEFTKLDKLHEESKSARDKAEAALRETIPPGSFISIKSGPEYLGRFEVLEYPAFSFGQVLVKNVDSGAERRVGYQQVKVVE